MNDKRTSLQVSIQSRWNAIRFVFVFFCCSISFMEIQSILQVHSFIVHVVFCAPVLWRRKKEFFFIIFSHFFYSKNAFELFFLLFQIVKSRVKLKYKKKVNKKGSKFYSYSHQMLVGASSNIKNQFFFVFVKRISNESFPRSLITALRYLHHVFNAFILFFFAAFRAFHNVDYFFWMRERREKNEISREKCCFQPFSFLLLLQDCIIINLTQPTDTRHVFSTEKWVKKSILCIHKHEEMKNLHKEERKIVMRMDKMRVLESF